MRNRWSTREHSTSEHDGGRALVAARRSFLLRVDPEVLDAVQRWANDELRSLNGQIEFILRAQLRAQGRLPKQEGANAKLRAHDASESAPDGEES